MSLYLYLASWSDKVVLEGSGKEDEHKSKLRRLYKLTSSLAISVSKIKLEELTELPANVPLIVRLPRLLQIILPGRVQVLYLGRENVDYLEALVTKQLLYLLWWNCSLLEMALAIRKLSSLSISCIGTALCPALA